MASFLLIARYYYFLVQFSRSVVSDSLWPHGPQHATPPCPSPTPRAYSNSCPLSQWCHPTISSVILCRPLLLLPSIFPSIGVFSNESVLCIRWPKLWSFSFSISPSNEYAFICTHIYIHIYSTHHHWFHVWFNLRLMIMYKTSQGQNSSPYIPTPVQSERLVYSIHNKVHRWDLWLSFILG